MPTSARSAGTAAAAADPRREGRRGRDGDARSTTTGWASGSRWPSGRPGSVTAGSRTSTIWRRSPAATVISKEQGLTLEDVKPEHFGTVRRAVDHPVRDRARRRRRHPGGHRCAPGADPGRAQPRHAGHRHRGAAGATGQARVQAGRDPRRRRHRARAQGEGPPDRGLAGGDSSGRRGGDRRGRRHRAAARRAGAGRHRPRGRLPARRPGDPARARQSRCSGSRPTPATTASR